MQYVAFLRGINVGGRIIKMADLKACFEGAGLKNVSTLLQTGNVTFESTKNKNQLKKLIETALTKTFNYPAKVQVLEVAELKGVIDGYPYDSTDDNFQHYVVFMEGKLAEEFAREGGPLGKEIEELSTGKGVIYWKVQKGMTLKSARAKYFTKVKYKDFNTSRNIKTLRKILL